MAWLRRGASNSRRHLLKIDIALTLLLMCTFRTQCRRCTPQTSRTRFARYNGCSTKYQNSQHLTPAALACPIQNYHVTTYSGHQPWFRLSRDSSQPRSRHSPYEHRAQEPRHETLGCAVCEIRVDGVVGSPASTAGATG